MNAHPFPASTLVVDLRGFGMLTNPQQLAARQLMYSQLAAAFTSGGIVWTDCAQEDRGDGVLIVVPTSVPKSRLLGPVLDQLVDPQTRWPRPVRIALHAGDIHHDGKGFVGSDVNHVFRLVNSAVLHEALERTIGTCAVLISNELHQGTVRHGYDTIDPRSYFQVSLAEKETRADAWLRIPGDDQAAEQISRGSRRRPAQPRPTRGVTLESGNNQIIKNTTIAGRDIKPRSTHRDRG